MTTRPHTYTFDVRLFATVRVTATTEADAQRKLLSLIDGADANLGSDDAGNPILTTVNMDDGGGDLMEIDGEAV